MKDVYKVLEDGNVEFTNYDSSGNSSIQKYKYNDNINEILAIENIIEHLKNEFIKSKNQIEFDKEILNSGINEFLFALFCAFSVVGGVVLSASFIGGITILLIGSALCIPTYIYNSFKESKEEKAIISKELILAEMEEIIDKYNMKLILLQKEQKKEHFENDKSKSFKVLYLDQLKMLKEKLNLYFDVNYNYKKIIKYYEQGNLDSKLSETYSQEEISTIMNYIEEKGLLLSKKYDKKKGDFYNENNEKR